MSNAQPTAEQIAALAKQMHIDKSVVEKSRHQQHHVPWNEMGETYRVSMLRAAEEQLNK